MRLCRDVLWQCPDLDERGFAPSHIGTGFGGFDPKRDLNDGMKDFLRKEGITLDEKGWLTDRSGRRWPVVCLGGTVARYQVKCAPLPIVAYDDYDFARDDGLRRNWWRAVNLSGEPTPAAPGQKERFIVSGIPEATDLHVVVVSSDGSNNRSRLSNAARLETKK